MVQERNASAYRSTPPASSAWARYGSVPVRQSTGRAIPAVPRYGSGARQASQADVNVRSNDAGSRSAHYQLTGQDGSYRTNGPEWGGNGGDPLASLFQGTPPVNPGSSSNGGGSSRYGGGGGGGGGGGVDPATAQAYKDLLASFSTGVGAEYDAYENSMRQAFDPGRINTQYDASEAAARAAAATGRQGVQTAAQGGMDRLVPIMQGLDSRAATARTGVNQAMSAGDARLAALQAQYQQQAAGANDGLNAVMDRFGAGPVQDTGEQALLNLFANSRIANSRSQGVMDAGLADRPAVYGGLQADVQSGISRDQGGLENRLALQEQQQLAELASQRQSALGANDQSLQQILGQTGVARIQAEQTRQQEELKLRAQLAELGIAV